MEQRLFELLRVALHYRASDILFSIRDNLIEIEIKANEKVLRIQTKEDDIKFFRFLQYKANLDVGNSLLPQTGRFEMKVDQQVISLRFAVLNSFRMTSGVLRILNNNNNLKIEDLTYSLEVIRYFRSIANFQSGLFVFSGPTSSGKTTTLYTILNQIKNKKIFTLEDPIEVFTSKYIQLQVNEKQNLGYDEGIKQLMRHSPDIIMIGEIRDSVAAKMAVRCALTGHLVVTSIHSSSCAMTIERLLELDVNRFQLMDVLRGISNQRLFMTYDEKNKTGVYEIMKRKDIEYYFEEKKLPGGFKTLPEAIEKAIVGKEISYKQKKASFDE